MIGMNLIGIAGPLVRIEESKAGTNLEQAYFPHYFTTGARTSEGKRFVKGSEPLCDALLFEPIPYRSALAEGCTHVLVFRTRPDGVSVTGKLSLVEKLTYRRFFSRKHELPGIAEWMIDQRHKRIYAEDVLRLNQDAKGQDDQPQLMTVALTAGMPEIHRLEMRREVLFEGVRNGFTVAYDTLVHDLHQRGRGQEIAREVFPDELMEAPPPNYATANTPPASSPVEVV